MFRRRRKDEDFAAEIQAHLDLENDRLREEGRPGVDARRAFGNAAAALGGVWAASAFAPCALPPALMSKIAPAKAAACPAPTNCWWKAFPTAAAPTACSTRSPDGPPTSRSAC